MINNNATAVDRSENGRGGSLEERYRVPSTRADHVLRPRLIELIDRGVKGPITLVSAPAGTGKSALVASWAASYRGRLVWMTLDDGDAEPGIFGERLAAGFESIGADLSCLGAYEEPIVLVLDAGPTSSNAARDHAVGDLLLGAKGVLRVVLIGRADPVFPMEWYRLSGDLTEVRSTDLAVTAVETDALLRRAGMVVTPEQAAALRARTNGWIIAVKFAIMSLAGREDISLAIQRFSESDFDIVTYLFNEVLEAMPLEIRDLLLRTSVVDVLTPELVELLAGGAQRGDALEFLANGNQFIERMTVGSQRRYRYQPLFRNFLRAQLAFEKPELESELQRSASEYLSRGRRKQDSAQLAVEVNIPRPTVGEGLLVPLDLPHQAGPHRQLPNSEEFGATDLEPQMAPLMLTMESQRISRPPSRPAQRTEVAAMAASGSVIEPLTPREREVLEHLSELLPTVEIALSMFVSVNTVRTHIRSILRKLGVSRRHEAVRRAWSLGLLPSPGDALSR